MQSSIHLSVVSKKSENTPTHTDTLPQLTNTWMLFIAAVCMYRFLHGVAKLYAQLEAGAA